MPQRRSSRNSKPKRWAVYECLHPGMIYVDRKEPRVKLFATQRTAKAFLGRRSRHLYSKPADAGWRGPIRVSYLSESKGVAFHGPWPSDSFLNGLREAPSYSTGDLLEDRLADLLWERRFAVDCYLGDDWGFEEMEKKANSMPGHTVEGLQIDDHLACIGGAVRDLQRALQACHRDLSVSAVRDFWTSLQVATHLAVFCGERIRPRPTEVGKLERARWVVQRQLFSYAEHLPEAGAGCLAENLQALRREANLTYAQLAEEVRLDESSVKRHCTGKARPRRDNTHLYAKVFSRRLGRTITAESLESAVVDG